MVLLILSECITKILTGYRVQIEILIETSRFVGNFNLSYDINERFNSTTRGAKQRLGKW
jgi:hypothetical protein